MVCFKKSSVGNITKLATAGGKKIKKIKIKKSYFKLMDSYMQPHSPILRAFHFSSKTAVFIYIFIFKNMLMLLGRILIKITKTIWRSIE